MKMNSTRDETNKQISNENKNKQKNKNGKTRYHKGKRIQRRIIEKRNTEKITKK